MLRSLAVLAALLSAASSFGQAGSMTRTDSVPDTVQLSFDGRSTFRSSPNTAVAASPSQTQPDYVLGYSLTNPLTGRRTAFVQNDLFTRSVYRNPNIFMSYTGNASGHAFTLPVGAFSLAGSVRFTGYYRSEGLAPRYIFYSSRPTSQVSGPTANLTATLNSNRMGQFSKPQFLVTGFFTNQNGINLVNQVTRPGGVTFNTFLLASPPAFTIPATRLTVPSNRITVPQAAGFQPVIAEFRTSYDLRLQ
jgi:hypothetical protein